MNGNFQEKRISADSDYGQQSSGKTIIYLYRELSFFQKNLVSCH